MCTQRINVRRQNGRRAGRWLPVGLLCLLLWLVVPAVLAQETETAVPTITVAPADTPLIIQGRLDGQTSSFSGSLRLTASGGDVAELRLLASDLQHSDQPERQIDRSQITISAGTGLSVGQPRDLVVTVNNVTYPGLYTGDLQFFLPGQGETAVLTIPLELHLTARPDVVPVTPQLAIQVVGCHYWLDCRLATWFLPRSVTQDEWQVWLDNRTVQPVAVTTGVAVLTGRQTGSTAHAGDVTMSLPHTLSAGQVEPLLLRLNRQQLAPDSYEGTLRLTVADLAEPLSIPLRLDVRQGPLWALLVLVLGIFLGRLARDMETPAAQTQVKLMPAYNRLRAKATALQDNEARTDALNQLTAFRQRLESGQETEEVLAALLDAIEARLQFFAGLEQLAADLPDALQERLAPKFAAARQAVIEGRQADADRVYTEIKQDLDKAADDGTMGVGAELVAFRAKMTEFNEGAARLWTAVQTKASSRWYWLLAFISGIRLTARTRYWVVRPILWLLLLVLLALLGMQALYVNAGTTFGAAGVYDYLALLLWGLTADVASRGLSSLPAKLGS